MWTNGNLSEMDLESLNRLAEQTKNLVNIETARFEKSYEQAIKNVPDEQKGKMQAAFVDMNKAVELAKEGKIDEANKIIANIKNYGR